MKLFFETTDALNFLLEKLGLFDSSILLKDPCSLCNINRNLWREKLEHDLNYANKKYFHPRFSSIIFVIIHINISNAWSSFSVLKFWRKKEHSLGTIIIIIEIWKNVRPIIVN